MTDFDRYLDQLYNPKFKDYVIRYIHLTCIQFGIKNYIINDDLTIDVDDNVSICNSGLAFIPLKFNIVKGDFHIDVNKITSLYGSPRVVNGDFNCSFNKLESLEYFPEYVEGDIFCSSNKLVTLKHIPFNFKNGLYCSDNCLISTMGISHRLDFLNITNNKFPNWFNRLKQDDKNLVLIYQEEYGIWYSDGSLNEKRFEYFIKDLKDNILIYID